MGLFSGIGNVLQKVAAPVLGFLGGPVGGIVGSAISGGLALAGQRSANQTNQQIADQATQTNITSAREANALTRELTDKQHSENRYLVNQQLGFQENLSNTAYQRAVQDMRLAGINPILAANQGGASTPSGSTGSAASGAGQQGHAVTTQVQNAVAPAISSAIAAKQLSNQTQLATAEIRIKKAEAKIKEEEARKFTTTGTGHLADVSDTAGKGIDALSEAITKGLVKSGVVPYGGHSARNMDVLERALRLPPGSTKGVSVPNEPLFQRIWHALERADDKYMKWKTR